MRDLTPLKNAVSAVMRSSLSYKGRWCHFCLSAATRAYLGLSLNAYEFGVVKVFCLLLRLEEEDDIIKVFTQTKAVDVKLTNQE